MNSTNEGFTDAISDSGAAAEAAPAVTVGEKRAADSRDDGNEDCEEVRVLKSGIKKMRGGGFGSDEEDMKRIAGIVLVLSAMGTMRGGRDPIGAEKAMMKEARARVVKICAELTPKDIIPREAFNGIIEDLGLSRFKEARLEFRAPKLSIAEKLELTTKKMRDSELAVATPSSAQNPQTDSGSSNENSGKPTLPFATRSEMPLSGNNPQAVPVRPVPSTATTISFQANALQPPRISCGLPAGRDSFPLHTRTEIHHTDRWPGGSSRATPAPAAEHVVKSFSPLQTQSASLGYINARNQTQSHPSVRPHLGAQSTKTVINQTLPGSIGPVHRPIQGMHGVQASHNLNSHQQICKMVQNGLYPKPPEHPIWIPLSGEFINKAVTCQVCQSTSNEVENMLVCDGCEKGFHLKCLKISNQKVVPKSDWHCSKCVTISKSKPFQPNYGRVMKNQNAKKKPGAHDHAPSQQKSLTSVNPSKENPCVAGMVTEPLETKVNPSHKMGGTETSLNIKEEDAGASNDHSDVRAGPVGTAYLDGCGNSSTDPVMESDPQPSEGTETNELHIPSNPPDFDTIDRSLDSCATDQSPSFCTHDHPPGSMNSVDETVVSRNGVPPGKIAANNGASNGPGVSLKYQDGSIGLNKCIGRSNGPETTNGLLMQEVKKHDSDSAQENQLGVEVAGSDVQAFHNVDWVGDADEVVDNKKFYQSCCINGLSYAVSDYVLIASSDGKFVPWKLQAMWEDCRTSSKRIVVSRCYFPDDLPATVGCPAPESNEVYESNHVSTLMAGLIRGPCKVLPTRKFEEENGKNDQAALENGDQPIFLCRWFFDKINCVFRPVPS